jgi:hypothetical protein
MYTMMEEENEEKDIERGADKIRVVMFVFPSIYLNTILCNGISGSLLPYKYDNIGFG